MTASTGFLRRALLAGTGTLFAAVGFSAQAQAQADAAVAQPTDEVVLVTGSRVRTGMSTPTPVTAVTADELQTLAPGVLVQSITQLPQFSGSGTPSNPGLTIAGPGPGALNLRGLGANRTLVLVDGRRLPNVSRYGSADANTIPEALVESVDIVTGGASAAYGTDAVAGVVNFKLNTDFTGWDVNLQGGVTERGDNENWKGSIAGGFALGDRGHLLVSGEYEESEAIESFEGRDWYKGTNFVQQTGASPHYLLRDNVVSTDATLDGLIVTFSPPMGIGVEPAFPGGPPRGLISSLNNIAFNPDGTYGPFLSGDPAGGGAQSITNGGSGTDLGADRYGVLPGSRRSNVFAYADYKLTSNVKVYAQGNYGKSYSDYLNPGGGLFIAAWPLQIFSDNAFLPEPIRQQMITEGLDSIALFRVGSIEDLAGSHTIADYETWSATVGFDAVLPDGGPLGGWSLSGYYQPSRSEFSQRQTNVTRTDRYPLAVDAVRDPETGEIVCNVTLYSDQYDDCVPFNPFGRGNASAEAIDWITGYDVGQQITTPLYYTDTGYSLGLTDSYVSTADKVSLGTIDQEVAEATLSGDLFGGIGAGPVAGAIGASYRQEELDQIVRAAGGNPANDPDVRPIPQNDPANGIRGFSPVFQSGSTDLQFSDVPNVRGSRDVKEIFGELLFPLLADKPFARQLNVSAAARWADYSASGGIWAWKYGVDDQLTDDLRLRATVSRDVRAPSFSELYESTAGAEQIYDPLLAMSKTAFFSGGGNPQLDPETADTTTIGVVYAPSFIDGLSISADWYDIDVSGAIGTLSSNQILQACVDGDAQLCALVERDPVTNEVMRVHRNYLNLNKLHVSGVDVEAAYRTSISLFGGDESFSTRLFLSWLDENAVTLASGQTTDYTGQVGAAPGAGGVARSLPEWKATASFTYAKGPLSLTLQERYIGSGYQNPNPVPGVTDIDRNDVPAVLYSDLRASYKLNDGKYEIYGAVTNLTDKAPPATPSGELFILSPYNSALYDLLGRRYVVGVRLKY